MNIDTAVEAGSAQLGPFQRAALRAGEVAPRMLAASTTRASGAAVHDAVLTVLAATPALRAELVDVQSMRVPWQRCARAAAQEKDDEGGCEVTAGATTVRITDRAGRCVLTVSTPPHFADGPSLATFFARVDAVLAGTRLADGPEPFAVETVHLEMMRAGELSTEERHWRARREQAGGEGDRLADVVPAREPGAASESALPLDGSAAAAALAVSGGGRLADVALFALCLMLERLGADADRVERTVDARDLMGLPGAVGVFCHAVPWHVGVDTARTVREGIAAAVARRREEDELIGCPAPGRPGELPEVLFAGDLSGPVLPDGWRFEASSAPPEGRLVFAVRDEGSGPELLVRAEDGRTTDTGVLVRLWHTAVTRLVAAPDAPARDVALGDDTALAALAQDLRGAARRDAADDICHALIRRAASDPLRPAVRWPGGQWSYAELLGRVRAVAADMEAVSAGDVVAVVAKSHQPEMLLGMLGALWRGAVFLPVDPDEPPARVSDALTRSAAVLVLCAVKDFTTDADVPVLAVGELGRSGQADVGLTAVAVPDDAPAYLLRTSGSTGRPKLVSVSRGSLANYLRWVADDLVAGVVGDRVLPVLSPAVFDAGFKQTLGMLYCGRTVWLPAADQRDASALLAELAATPGGVAVNCVPSYWSALLEAAADGPLPRIEKVLLGGETLTEALLERTRAVFPAAEVWNLYGPTETTATATMGRIDAHPVHVGRPVAGAVLTVLDRHGAPLPRRVAGEVCIAGPGVALGYLSGQEPPSPFVTLTAAGVDAAAYRTGDHGWIDTDGTVRLLGRRDDQVKVNGWRIELGEIESAAEQLDGVTRAVVVVDGTAVLRLFVTGAVAPEPVLGGLAALLPGPMLPSSVHVIDRFPLLPSGKIDRGSLPAVMNRAAEEDPRVYDAEQLVVATAWKELLSTGWPRVTDEFFASGGHSLMLAQLVNKLRAQGFSRLSLRHVIRRPTVESIAALIRSGAEGAS